MKGLNGRVFHLNPLYWQYKLINPFPATGLFDHHLKTCFQGLQKETTYMKLVYIWTI